MLCSDAEQQDIAFSVAEGPAHGTLSAITQQPFLAGYTQAYFTYLPEASYRGPDAFKLKASDGANDTVIEFTVNVTEGVNDPPQCSDAAATVQQPGPADILANCTDDERADLTYAVTDEPDHGQLTMPSRGTFRYTPDGDFTGADQFRYSASDGNASSNEATVRIQVLGADPLLLSPGSDTPEVGGRHTVLASVRSASGAPQSGKRVRWQIAGAGATLTGEARTNASGQLEISWTRGTEGKDVLSAYVDMDDDGAHDPDEAASTATAHWRAERDVDPPSAGQPTAPDGDPINVDVGTQIDPDSPEQRNFMISLSQTWAAGIRACPGGGPGSREMNLPITISIDPGAGGTVQAGSVRLLLVDPETGDTSNPLDPPGAVAPSDISGTIYRFVLTCVRSGDLYVRYTLEEGGATETYIVPIGGLTLIDPQGVVYDKAQYEARIAAGDTPEAARGSAAISGASAVLQRKVGAAFTTVLSGDPGISPHVNPQITGTDGRFQWDVSAGIYRVVVSKEGYETATSESYEIPPPKLDAHIAMTRPGSAAVDATPAVDTTPAVVTAPPPAAAPLPPPAQPLAPRPPPTAAPLAAGVSFRTSPRSLRVSRSGGFAYPFAATASKSGKISLTSTKKLRIGSAKRFMKLAAKAFTARSSGKPKVTFKLSAANLKALKRVRSLRFDVSATLGAKTFSTTLTLKAPRTS